MKRKEIIERIARIPAWALSTIAAFLAAVILGFLINNFIDTPLNYVVWSLMNASASFLICILHPKRVWIVPLLCNSLLLLPATLDNSFWVLSFGMIMGIGLVFSILMAHLGALIGRRRDRRNTIKSE